MRTAVRVAVVVGTLALSGPLVAHPGPRERVRALTRVIDAAGPATEGAKLLERAMARRDEGELEDAEADLAAAERAAHPADAGLVALERARIAKGRGDHEAALASYDTSLRMQRPAGRSAPGPAFGVALAERAVTKQRLARWRDARADWEAAFQILPTADAALARGAIDEAEGDLDRAVEGYREGMAVTPSIALARALARALLAQGDDAEVIALADEAIASSPWSAEWLLLRADALEARGDVQAAREDRLAASDEVEAAMRVRPSDLRRLLRARVWLALGRGAEAAREAESIAKEHPTLREASDLAREARSAEGLGR